MKSMRKVYEPYKKLSHLSGCLIFSSSIVPQVTVRVETIGRRISLKPTSKVIHLESQKCSEELKTIVHFQIIK